MDARSACCKPVYLPDADITHVLRHRALKESTGAAEDKRRSAEGISARPDPIPDFSAACKPSMLRAPVFEGWEKAYSSAPCSQ